jgi:spore germination protein GerM
VRRVAVLLVGMAFVSACRPEGVTVLSDAELPTDVYGSPQPTPDASPEQVPRTGTVYLVRDGRLVGQRVTLQQQRAESLQEALMLALLSASAPPQPRRGPTSEIPELTQLLDIEVDGTVATVNLSPDFRRGPAESLALRLAQVVYTLTEEPSQVIGVRLEINGIPEEVRSDVDRPAFRSDFREFAPQPPAA